MAPFTRQEMEDAFERYRDKAARAAASNDWREWADQFTEDAEYVEHHLGSFTGREAIYEWITSTMAAPINNEMNAFPVDWYVIDEERGWVVCAIWNRMRDIGDGKVHQAINWTRLKYAGDDQWSFEEDLYNPAEFTDMIKTWMAAKG